VQEFQVILDNYVKQRYGNQPHVELVNA